MSNIRYELKLNIFFYKIEILLYPNLSVYVCEASSWKLEPRPLSSHTPQALILVEWPLRQRCAW